MRFDISDFPDGDVECLNEHVVIFRGKSYEFIHRLFESNKGGLAAKPVGKGGDLHRIRWILLLAVYFVQFQWNLIFNDFGLWCTPTYTSKTHTCRVGCLLMH